ncbi:hypothetical protein AB0K48_11200 [Nonomuraea sp. NPDC055795]
MGQPALVPAVPTPSLWLEMELVWRMKHIAFYQGPHAVEPLEAGDLDTLRAVEVLVDWVLSEDVWPEPVNLNDRPDPGGSRPPSGEPVRFSSHDHDEQHLHSHQLWQERPGDGDDDGPLRTTGAIWRARGRLVPHQRSEGGW